MALSSVCWILAPTTTATTPPSKLERSSFAGVAVHGLPVLRTASSRFGAASVLVEARTRKVVPKEPFGPSGGAKFKDNVDASGRVAKGKGVYQFAKKYGANVDGYSPIYDKEEWSKSGDVYTAGTPGLAIWAALLGGLLITGAVLVYNTSALVP